MQKKSKNILGSKFETFYIDEIYNELAKHNGFTEDELDFIINYDIKHRMGEELNVAEQKSLKCFSHVNKELAPK